MEHRQLRYFVTPVEELHFSRAAAREHIVQSPLSQQLQRLERKLGILLLDRTTHHVQLTPAGSSTPVLRVGVVDPNYDSMPQILRQKQEQYPELEIHQVEAGAPEQVRQLASGRLNVGIGECR
jgi:DNA-binding transcriptional LysR family regulator